MTILSNLKEIEVLQKKLNAPEVIPVRGFRRNVSIYQLICYVNNITGCYISRNLEPVPIFIERAKQFMEENDSGEHEEYFSLVSKYIDAMEKNLPNLR